MSVVALIVLPTVAGPEPSTLVEALFEGGFPVLSGRAVSEDDVVLPWLSEDGPRRIRAVHAVSVPEGRLGPRSPDAKDLQAGRSHLRVTLEQGPEEALEADILLVEAVAALLPRLRAVAARLAHCEVWIRADEFGALARENAGFGVPAELLVDLQIGPVGPEAVGVLTTGLERYGLREVLAVADRTRLEPAWRLAVDIAEDRLLGAEPSVDLSQGPHPTRPTDTVDVGFVDEEVEDEPIDVSVVSAETPDA